MIPLASTLLKRGPPDDLDDISTEQSRTDTTPSTEVLEEDFSGDRHENISRIKNSYSKMRNKWRLSSDTVVEDQMLKMILSNPDTIPHNLAALCIMYPDPAWTAGNFFTKSELEEIAAKTPRISLRIEELEEDEKGLIKIMDSISKQAGRRLGVSKLQDMATNFKSEFKEFVHPLLLWWLDESFTNFAYNCVQPPSARPQSESSLGINIWTRTLDRAPVVGTSFRRYVASAVLILC